MRRAKLRKGLAAAGLFLLLVGITFWILLRGQDPKALTAAFSHARLPFLGIGAACMVLFVCCEAKNLHTALGMFGSPARYSSCVGYALTGFFFSSVTPSSSGGQPMQLYAMHRDGHPAAPATLSLLTELACFQAASVLLALVGFLAKRGTLLQLNGHFRLLLALGVGLNLGVLVCILCAIFSKRLAPAVWGGLMKLCQALHLKKTEQWRQAGAEQLESFRQCARCFGTHKGRTVQMFLTSLVQLLAYHSIPFWIYASFGLQKETLLGVVGLQAVLYVTVSALPLPGAVGVSEGGFLLLYQTLFPASLLEAAMLLSRVVNFYLFVLLSGLFVSFAFLRARLHPKRSPLLSPRHLSLSRRASGDPG